MVEFLSLANCPPSPLLECTHDVTALFEWQAVCAAQILPSGASKRIEQTPSDQTISWSFVTTGVPSTGVPTSSDYVNTVWGSTSATLPAIVSFYQLNNSTWKGNVVPALLPKAAKALSGGQKAALQAYLTSTLQEWKRLAWPRLSLSRDAATMLLAMDNTLQSLGGSSFLLSLGQVGAPAASTPALESQDAQVMSAAGGSSQPSAFPSSVAMSISNSSAGWPYVSPNNQTLQSPVLRGGSPAGNNPQLFGTGATAQNNASLGLAFEENPLEYQQDEVQQFAAQQTNGGGTFIAIPFTGDPQGVSYTVDMQRIGNTGAFNSTTKFPAVPQARYSSYQSQVRTFWLMPALYLQLHFWIPCIYCNVCIYYMYIYSFARRPTSAELPLLNPSPSPSPLHLAPFPRK